MPLVSRCGYPGCSTLTMGVLCVAHEPPVTKTFPRGRPYVCSTDEPQATQPSSGAVARGPLHAVASTVRETRVLQRLGDGVS